MFAPGSEYSAELYWPPAQQLKMLHFNDFLTCIHLNEVIQLYTFQ